MKQESRRSMSEALRTIELPPEAVAVIKEGTPRPFSAVTKPVLVNDLTDRGGHASPGPSPSAEVRVSACATVEERPVRGSDGTGFRAAKPKRTREAEPEPAATSSNVSLTVRVPSEIPLRLLRVSTDRKIGKVRPCSQQEIVAEALMEWLKKHNY